MRKAIRLAVCIWCGVGLGGTLRAQPQEVFDTHRPDGFDADLFACIGQLSTETHQQLLDLLGRPVLTLIDPLDGLAMLTAAASTFDTSAILPESTAWPQQVPEPGMFTLLTLAAAAVLGYRRRSRPQSRRDS